MECFSHDDWENSNGCNEYLTLIELDCCVLQVERDGP